MKTQLRQEVTAFCSSLNKANRSLVQIPQFSESSHPLIQSLSHYSDRELLALFERYPQQGKYFTAIFCRYSSTLYVLVASAAHSAQQAHYLHALTWQRIFSQMREDQTTFDSFQHWLIHTAATFIQHPHLEDELIRDELAISPPLWCYVDRSLEQLPPRQRFVLVMSNKFGWSNEQIIPHLPSGVTPEDIQSYVDQGYQALQAGIPEDIRQIYLQPSQKSLTGRGDSL
ncbi:MAG: sigma-70 family RNA polymerase sigma factor [Cyanophyceae cyanobacterium]